MLVLFSCGKKYNPTSIPDFPKDPKDDPIEVVEEVTEEVIEEEPVIEEEESETGDKKYFEVAVMLPFNVHNNRLDVFNDSIAPKSQTAVELYNGIKLATEELTKSGLSFSVSTFDTKNDVEHIKFILQNLEYSKPDVIIGPLYNKHLSLVCDFARENDIPIISPLSPPNTKIYDTPQYVALNPSLGTHMEKIYDQLTNVHSTEPITVISDSHQREMKMAGKFLKLNNPYGIEGYDKIEMRHMIFDQNWEDEYLLTQFDSLAFNNTVVVTSLNEEFVSMVLSRLTALSGTFPYTVYGMPNWIKFNSLNFDHLQEMNFHFTSAFWKDPLDVKQQIFKTNYRNKFYTLPTDISARGYDVMMFLGQVMNETSLKYQDKLDDLPSASVFSEYELNEGWNVRDTLADFSKPDYLENKFLYMIKFKDMEFQLVD